MEGATEFRKLLKQRRLDGLTLGYKEGTNYILIKVDDLTYQLYIDKPP